MQSNNKQVKRVENRFKKIDFRQNIVYFAFLVVVVLFSVMFPGKFLTLNNVLNITRQTAMISIMAIAMTFVIATGQIDLSIGSIAACSSLIAALLLRYTGSIALALAGALVFGIACGLLNGVLTTRLGIPPFLVTLGTMGILKGFAMWITDTQAIPITVDGFNQTFGLGTVLGVPILFLWTILALIIGYVFMNKTAFGKKTLAIGGNETSARYSGINIDKIKVFVMAATAFAASFAGILYAARMRAGRYTFGEGDELSVIAAVILGGTSMSGGTANVFGAVVGSLLMGSINNGLIIGGLSVSQQMMVRGAIVILATALGNRTKNNQS